MSAHPGFIVYSTSDGSAPDKKVPIAQVPQSARFAPGAKGESVPVVKVVASPQGSQLRISEYGAGGELLRTTVSAR